MLLLSECWAHSTAVPSFTSKNQRCWDKWWAVSKCSPMHVLSQSEMSINLSRTVCKGNFPVQAGPLLSPIHWTTSSASEPSFLYSLPPEPLPKHNTWAKCSYCSCRRVALTATQDNGGRIKDTVQPPGKGTATPTASSIAAVLQWAKAACSILYLKSILEWLYTSCQRSLKCRSEQCVDAKGYRYNTYSTTQFLE